MTQKEWEEWVEDTKQVYQNLIRWNERRGDYEAVEELKEKLKRLNKVSN